MNNKYLIYCLVLLVNLKISAEIITVSHKYDNTETNMVNFLYGVITNSWSTNSDLRVFNAVVTDSAGSFVISSQDIIWFKFSQKVRVDVIRILADEGADFNTRCKSSKLTALEAAIKYNYTLIVDYFLEQNTVEKFSLATLKRALLLAKRKDKKIYNSITEILEERSRRGVKTEAASGS